MRLLVFRPAQLPIVDEVVTPRITACTHDGRIVSVGCGATKHAGVMQVPIVTHLVHVGARAERDGVFYPHVLASERGCTNRVHRSVGEHKYDDTCGSVGGIAAQLVFNFRFDAP